MNAKSSGRIVIVGDLPAVEKHSPNIALEHRVASYCILDDSTLILRDNAAAGFGKHGLTPGQAGSGDELLERLLFTQGAGWKPRNDTKVKAWAKIRKGSVGIKSPFRALQNTDPALLDQLPPIEQLPEFGIIGKARLKARAELICANPNALSAV